MEIEGRADGSEPLLETADPGAVANPIAQLVTGETFKLKLARIDKGRDRAYAAFKLGETGTPYHVTDWLPEASANHDPYPVVASKKGLQVQMVDDALAIGTKHAALNLNLSQLLHPTAQPGDVARTVDSQTFQLSGTYAGHLDQQIKTLSDAGVVVSIIVLAYQSGVPELDTLLLHPKYDKACPNHLGAFNTVTPEGRRAFRACMEFLAERYSTPGYPHGRVANYIMGNEVNSHWFWANMGHVTMEEFTNDYLEVVRLAHTAVRQFSTTARVFLSMEHHWNIRYPGGDAGQAFEGRKMIDYFARKAREEGDFSWNLAFHPYPENLFKPRTWEDKSATREDNTPRITFKNLDLLTRYFEKPELRFQGQPRRIILSEQGFHSDTTEQGELVQAAAYAYAFRRVASLNAIDSFILHRHVDHKGEGGLNLGLWRCKQDSPSPSDPSERKKIYELYKAADTDNWKSAFEFALPIIGIKDWSEVESGAK